MYGKTVRARGYGREGYGCDIVVICHGQRIFITIFQVRSFHAVHVPVYGPYGMDNEFSRQLIAIGYFCLAGFAAAQAYAGLCQFGARSLMDSAVYPTANRKFVLAALTTASTGSVVMSPLYNSMEIFL